MKLSPQLITVVAASSVVPTVEGELRNLISKAEKSTAANNEGTPTAAKSTKATGSSKSSKAAIPETSTAVFLTTTTTLPKTNQVTNDDWDCSSPHPLFPLDVCQGECDKDCHCKGELICYQRGWRSVGETVPGCDGAPKSRSDFCVDPQAVDDIRTSLYDFDNTDFSSQYVGTSTPTQIRLFWHEVYYWQGTREETFWCMQCEGPCEDGQKIKIHHCDYANERQYFIAVGETIRPLLDTNLCITETGLGREDDPVQLSPCNNGASQQFWGYREQGPFQLRPRTGTDLSYCLTQMHHPKAHEAVFPRNCTKAEENDTSLWTTY